MRLLELLSETTNKTSYLTDISTTGGGQSVALHQVAHDDGGGAHVTVDLPRLGQVGDAGVGAHQDIDWVQAALEELLLGLGEMDPAQGRLGQVVMRHQGQAVEANIVDGVHCLEDAGHPLKHGWGVSDNQSEHFI